MNFFRKGLKSLEAVDPHVRMIAERQHIDYQFSGLEDDGGENDNNDDGNDFDVIEGGELSFDYRANKQGPYIVSTSPNTAEVGNLYYSKLEWFSKPGCILNFILIAHLLFYLKYYQTLSQLSFYTCCSL